MGMLLKHNIFVLIVALSFLAILSSAAVESTAYELPAVPQKMLPLKKSISIPQIKWVAKSSVNGLLESKKKRSRQIETENWKTVQCDEKCRDLFMSKTFSGTFYLSKLPIDCSGIYFKVNI